MRVSAAVFLFAAALPNTAIAGSLVGKAAPDFTLTGIDGGSFTLSAQKGQVVVLEWFNPGCPFVQQAHGPGGALAALAGSYTGEGVVWVAINSSAPGKEGHGLEVNQTSATAWSMLHPVLLDEDGKVGKAYRAVTTPQMVVIDAAGTAAYAGALDNAPLGKTPTGAERSPWLQAALDDVRAGRPVGVPETKSWGCSVKY